MQAVHSSPSSNEKLNEHELTKLFTLRYMSKHCSRSHAGMMKTADADLEAGKHAYHCRITYKCSKRMTQCGLVTPPPLYLEKFFHKYAKKLREQFALYKEIACNILVKKMRIYAEIFRR